MGMIAYLTAVSPEKLAEFQADPERIEDYVFPDSGDEPPHTLDLDKAWHAIHYLLTGTTWDTSGVLGLTILGGTDLGDVEVGMDPARMLTPAEVASVSAALLPVTELKQRFDPVAMQAADIYPHVWTRDGAQALGYVLEYYDDLVPFYRAAASRGDGMLLYIA